ncbi:MAG: MmcB family DNA repair protein [Chloroflexota bacterium]|nr:MmcB family DNA repair protein [Chloroflexota bacterium]
MYKVDIANKKLIEIPVTSFGELNLKERFDIQEWIDGTPEILGEALLIIGKELILPSGKRLDLLAVDKQGAMVVIELKRDDSGTDVEWQAIKYASYCSSFSQDDIYKHFAEYLGTDADDAQVKIEEFINCEPEDLNERQRIVLVSKEFHSEVISAVLWLRESEIDVECIRLTPHRDATGSLFVNPEIIIPLPEAKDYIQKKESKQKEQKRSGKSSFSLEKSNLSPDELKQRIIQSLTRPSDLTKRFRAFLEIIAQEDRRYDREEIKQGLHEAGIGNDIGQSGRYLSNISQFLTKKSNPHLRQAIEFETGGEHGEMKNNYHVISDHRALVLEALQDSVPEIGKEFEANKQMADSV